jgi:hypothetical protein
METYQLLKRIMELPNRIFQHNADRLVELILGFDPLQQPLCLLLVILVGPGSALHDPHANHLVAVVHHVVEQPDQRTVRVRMLVHSNHEGAGSSRRMVALVPRLERKRRGIILGRLPDWEVIEPDMLLESVRRKRVCC